ILERVAQRNLHHTRTRQQSAVVPKTRGTPKWVVADAVRIEPHRIGHIKGLESKLQVLPFRNAKYFGKTCVDAEISIAAKDISLACLSGIGSAYVGECHCLVLEHVGIAGIGVVPSRGNRSSLDVVALSGPVGAPAQAIYGAERQTAGPMREPGKRPAADQRIHCAVYSRTEGRASSKGQSNNEIARNYVAHIEIRWSAISTDIPGID